MSAYSDWKCGALSDEDYTAYCNHEAAKDKAYEDLDCHNSCADCDFCGRKITEEPCCSCTAELDDFTRERECE